MTVCAFLIAYAFLGCVYWLWMLVGTIRVGRAVPMLAKAAPPDPGAWPRLSIIIPACNEAAELESALVSVLQQDYPELEIILIDDRSTDGTAAIVDRMAAADPRIVALHVQELPDGWLGKVHAMDLGVRKANGSWLLFTDADVYFAPAHCGGRSDTPCATTSTIWRPFRKCGRARFLVDACIALFCRAFAVAMRLWGVADLKSAAFAGVGAFNLVRRAALERIEGFPWLRMEVADDMGLGMMLKQSGHGRVVDARGVLGLYWYRTLGEMATAAKRPTPGRRVQPAANGDTMRYAGGPGVGAAGRHWPVATFAACVGPAWRCWRRRSAVASPLRAGGKLGCCRACCFLWPRSSRRASCSAAAGSDSAAAESCGAARSIARSNCLPAAG